MSENFNVDANISSKAESSSSEHNIFQKKENIEISKNRDKDKIREAEVKEFQYDKKVGVTEVDSASQVGEKSEEIKKVISSEDLEKKELKAVDTSQHINEPEETKVFSTYQDFKKKEESETTCISQDTEKYGETAVLTDPEASEDCEGILQIHVSEPFSLTEDIELYLSEGCSEEGTENITSLSEQPSRDQNCEVLSNQEIEIIEDTNSTNLDISDQTPVEDVKSHEESGNLNSITKPYSQMFTNFESKDLSPRKPDEVTESKNYSHIQKRRGRPPKSTKKNYPANSNKSSNKIIKPLEINSKEIATQKNIDASRTIETTIIVPINSCDKNVTKCNSEDIAKNVDCQSEPPRIDQNFEAWIKQETEIVEINPISLEISDQITPVEDVKNHDESGNFNSIIKPCSQTLSNVKSKDKSPRKSNELTETENNSYIHKPKRRGRPPKSVINQAESDMLSNKIIKPLKINSKEIKKPVSVDSCEIIETKSVLINSFDKTEACENKKEHLLKEESSPNHEERKSTINIITPKDLKTLAKLMSENSPGAQELALGKVKKLANGSKKVSSIVRSEKVEISNQRIPSDTNINVKSTSNRFVKNNMESAESSTTLNSTDLEALTAKDIFSDNISNNVSNSEKVNTDNLNISKDNPHSENYKRQHNLEKSNGKSHTVTVITPRELISRTLEKLTIRKPPLAKEKTSVKEDNLESCNENFLQAECKKTPVEGDNSKNSHLPSKQSMEKNKKEDIARELINRTVAKLVGHRPQAKQKKSWEGIKTNDLSEGPCLKKNEKEEVSKQPPLASRAVIPDKMTKMSVAKNVIPIKQKIKENIKNSLSLESTDSEEAGKKEDTNNIPIHKNNSKTENQMLMPQNKNGKIKIQLDEPSSKICSTLKTITLSESNVNNKKTIQSTVANSEKKMSSNETSNKKASQKTLEGDKCIKNQSQTYKSIISSNKKCPKNQFDEKKKKSLPSLSCITQTEPELGNEKGLKSIQPDSKKVLRRKKSHNKQFTRSKTRKLFQKAVPKNKSKLKSNKPLVVSLNKKVKSKVQVDVKLQPLLEIAVAKEDSSSKTVNNFESGEKILEVQQKEICSNLLQIPTIDQIKFKKQIKAFPIVCLVDYKKIGSCALNKEVSKNNFQKINDLKYIPNQTDNHMTGGSSEYFKQLELSPSSKSQIVDSYHKRSSTTPNERRAVVKKDSQVNDVLIINDHDYGIICSKSAPLASAQYLEVSKPDLDVTSHRPASIENSTSKCLSVSLTKKNNKHSQVDEIIIDGDNDDDRAHHNDHDNSEVSSIVASLPSNSLEEFKQYPVGSSQKSISIENLTSRNSPGNCVLEKTDSNFRKQSLPTKELIRTFSLSTHGQKDGSNYATQFQSLRVVQPQSLEPYNYKCITPNLVQKNDNSVISKLAGDLATSDLTQKRQPKTQVKRGVSPFMQTQTLTQSTWNKNSYSSRVRMDHTLKFPPKVPISGEALSLRNPVSSGSKNYYFTPLYGKIVPINLLNPSKDSIRNNDTTKSLLDRKSCNSTASKTSHSKILIENKTVKPMPVLDFLAIPSSSALSPAVANSKLDLSSLNLSSSRINQKISGNSGSCTVSSTQFRSKNLELITKRKHAGSNGISSQFQNEEHCSSSTHCNAGSDHLTAPKKIKYQSRLETNHISIDQGSTKIPESITRKRISSECEYEVDKSVSSSNECDKSTSPKRRKYQEQHITNNMSSQSKERKSEVSSSNSYEPDTNYASLELGSVSITERTSEKEMSCSMLENQNNKSNCQNNGNKKSKGNEENLGTLNDNIKTKENMYDSMSKSFENKKSGCLKQGNEEINRNKGVGKNENKQDMNDEKRFFTLDCKKSLPQKEMPVHSSINLNNESSKLKKENKQVNSKKTDVPSLVKKRVKSKEEELEDCLDGVPPFIREVFKCENIRDGFDNKDLIFVLSLLPDIEEMTSTQRIIFQSRTVKIINDVFTSVSTNPQFPTKVLIKQLNFPINFNK